MKTFGVLLKDAREQNGLTIKDVSEISGVTEAAISMIENNKREPQLSTALKLMRAVHIPIHSLLFIKEKK